METSYGNILLIRDSSYIHDEPIIHYKLQDPNRLLLLMSRKPALNFASPNKQSHPTQSLLADKYDPSQTQIEFSRILNNLCYLMIMKHNGQ